MGVSIGSDMGVSGGHGRGGRCNQTTVPSMQPLAFTAQPPYRPSIGGLAPCIGVVCSTQFPTQFLAWECKELCV